jgi:hypothetical protein
MPRDILIMTSDADGIRQLKLDADACELRLPGLPSLRLGLADLEFLASYVPMIADAAFARAAVPPLFPEEEEVGAVSQAGAGNRGAAAVAVSPAQDRRRASPPDQSYDVIEDDSPAQGRVVEDSKAEDSKAGKRWSDEEEGRLRQLLLDGHSIPEVATLLKRSPGSVIARALLRGMIAVNVTPELVEQGDQQSDRGGEAGSERRAA